MIDTIVLLLSKKDFTITNPENFSPSAHWILKHSIYTTYHLKPIQFSKNNATNYRPRLTLSNRNNVDGVLDTVLKIEFSIPKLLHGNNFIEVRYKDFDAITMKLHQILAHMGVQTTVAGLQSAPVTTVHYAKNIVLTDGTTPHYLISKLQKMCM